MEAAHFLKYFPNVLIHLYLDGAGSQGTERVFGKKWMKRVFLDWIYQH